MTFHWKTADELQVGKIISLWIEIRGLPYFQTNFTNQEIKFEFNKKQINYFSNEFDVENNKISKIDYVTFNPDWKNNLFKSDELKFRFMNPVEISANLCDLNLQPNCVTLENIIHPAPHYMRFIIDSNRIEIGLSIIIVGFTASIIWLTILPKLKD